MTRKLVVEVVADASTFKRGLKESSAAATQFESKVKESTAHVRSHILGLGAAFVGVGGIVEGLSKSIGAAEDLEKATRGLDAQLKANHESLKAITPQLATLESTMAKVGFTNTQTEQAFTRLDRASGSSAAAFKYMSVAADLAAAKHIDLSQAALVVGKVMDGATSAMNRYGIAVPKGASATEALAIAQQKLAGQAAAAATPMERFHATLTNMEATIGQQLLPTINKYLNVVSEWFSKSENQRKVTEAVKTVLHDLGVILDGLKMSFDRIWPVIVKVKELFGDWKPLIVAAGAALVALGVLAPWTAFAVGAVYVITHWEKVKSWFKDLWARMKAGFNILWDELKAGAYKAALDVVEPFSHLPGALGGWARKAKDSLNKGLDAIQADMARNGDTITAAWGQAGKKAGMSWAAGFKNAVSAQKQAVTDSLTQGTGVTYGPGGAPMSAAPGSAGYHAPGAHGSVGGKSLAGENPAIAKGLNAVAAAGYNVDVTSGRRSYAAQSALYNRYAASGFNIKYIAAKPGQSNHESGNAVDVFVNGKPVDQSSGALAILKKYGLVADVAGDHEHLDYRPGGGRSSSAGGGGSVGPLPGDAAAAAASEKAKTAAATKAASAAKAAAAAAYRSWKENYFTPLDNEYKSDLLVTDEAKRLNKLQALHAKLAIDLKTATGHEHQDIFNEETKVAGKIQSLRRKMADAQKALIARQHNDYVNGLQDDLASAQTLLTRQQTLFDRAFSRIAAKITAAFQKATAAGLASIQAKYGAATPEEQARDAFQAQLDAAKGAAELAAAQNDLISAQLAGDPEAVRAAQSRLDDVQNAQKLSDLQQAADRSRAIANAAADKETAVYQAARDDQLANLNDWLDDQKSALEAGTETWSQFWQAAFSDAPEKYAPDAVSSLQGVIDQLARIKALQDAIASASGNPSTSGGVSLPGGLSVPAGVLGHGFGGGFADGGVVPGSLGQPMMILAHGGERVIPNGGAGGGGGVVNVYVTGWVGSDQQIARRVRDELVTLGRRDKDIFGGFA